MAILEPAVGVRLERPEEPVDMRERLRDTLLAGPKTPDDRFADDMCLAVWLWGQWRPTLEPLGMHREAFVDVIVGYRREVWLWLQGERGWEQMLDGLGGRVARRLPAP
ncbi:MAG TPA: hypothetical protein VKU86_09170 [Acidimicrobiales bacterium]|nr:hypothetical protein [Acidimicrobiales bacterium]